MASRFKYFLTFLFVVLLLIFAYSVYGLIYKDPTKQNKQEAVQSKTQGVNISQSDNLPAYVTSIPTVKVTRVIDGDTIEIEGGQKVRYIGIDTPETVDPRKPVQCFGIEASNINKELVEGKNVRLAKDISEIDKYGRLLRYVYVDNTFVNDLLVREGYAHSSSYPPDIKYQNQLTQAEQEAQQNSRGLWSACNSTYRTPPQTVQLPPDQNCVIKGNISSSGEKIYHMPGQYYYNKTQIDESKGEKWFCAEEDAKYAGWRKSKK